MAVTTAVLICDQDEVGWGAVRHALDQQRVTIVGEADTAESAIALAARHRPDLVLGSSRLDGGSSLATLAQIRRIHSPESRVIVFARRLDQDELLAFARLDLSGLLSWRETRSRETIACTIRLALLGEAVAGSRSIARNYDNALRGLTEMGVPVVELSDFERRLLAHRAQGRAYAEIARFEGLTERQVQHDFAVLQDKLDACDLFTLGMRATLLGLVP